MMMNVHLAKQLYAVVVCTLRGCVLSASRFICVSNYLRLLCSLCLRGMSYMRMHIDAHTHARMRTRTHLHARTHARTHAHARAHACTHTRTHTNSLYLSFVLFNFFLSLCCCSLWPSVSLSPSPSPHPPCPLLLD